MKIAWFCIPAYGHTNPTLGVVRELTGAGHEVTYFSFERFRREIEAAGAAFVPCDGYDLHIDAQNGGNRVGRDLAFSIELIVDAALSMDALVERTIPVLKPDLIVADSMAFSGKLAALKYGVPYVCSTTTFAFNRYAAKYMEQGMGGLWQTLRALPKINRQLKRLRAAGYPVKSFLELISNDNDTQMNRVDGRHDGRVNTAYVEGHVDSKKKTDIARDRAYTKTIPWWSHASTASVRALWWNI